jgi:hypothetical protein
MAARLLGIATRTIYRHLEKENEENGGDLDDQDESAGDTDERHRPDTVQ